MTGTAEAKRERWGTRMPIALAVKDELVEVRAFGMFAYAARATDASAEDAGLGRHLADQVLMAFTIAVGETAQKAASVDGLLASAKALAAATRAQVESAFAEREVELKALWIEKVERV